MKNKTQVLAFILSVAFHPWIWFCARFSSSLLKATLVLVRTLLHPRLASMLTDEILLKTGVNGKAVVSNPSLMLIESFKIRAELEINDAIQRSFFLRGFPDFMFELLHFCDSKTCYFDIGANVGLVACAVSRWVPGENIYCFEPIPDTFNKLKQNLAVNCPGASAYLCALSDRSGNFDMVLLSADSGSASLEIKYRTDRINKLGYRTDLELISVQTMRFSEFIAKQSVDFTKYKKAAFKIDVEGHEVSVLAGMEDFIQRYSTQLEMLVVVEVHTKNFHEVNCFFSSRGFIQIWPDETSVNDFHHRQGAAIDLIFHHAAKI